MAGMLSTMRVNEDRMREGALGGFMAATDLADLLATRGVPFREAHEIVGRIVLDCERAGRTLQDLTPDELKAASAEFGDDALSAVDIDAVVARRDTFGGTAPDRVDEQLTLAREALGRDSAWLEERLGD
jgi:argininosuccinate lyase